MKKDVYKRMKRGLFFALLIFLCGTVLLPLIDYVVEMEVMQSMFGPLLFAPFVISLMLLPLILMFSALVWAFFILFKTRKEITAIDARQTEYMSTSKSNSLKKKNNELLTVLFLILVLVFLFSFFVRFLEQVGS